MSTSAQQRSRFGAAGLLAEQGRGAAHAGSLTVSVTARAVNGAATDAAPAALAALAGALGLTPRQVWLVRGATARQKTLGVAVPVQDLAGRLATHEGSLTREARGPFGEPRAAPTAWRFGPRPSERLFSRGLGAQ